MNVRTLRLSTLGACLLAIGAVALNTTGGASAPPPPPPPNGDGGVIQSCGPDNYTYCHGEFWDSTITYQSTNAFPIALLFNGGSLETCCDWISVYDGMDVSAPLILDHITGSLTGVFAASTNPDNALFVMFHTDVSVSCQSGSNIMLDWTVSCLDCTAPDATFDIFQDCSLGYYNVVVTISQMGTDPSIDITNTGGAATVVATAPGVYNVGPFTPGQLVQVTLENELNPLCNVSSGVVTNSPCPIVSCGPDNYTHCYQNSATYIAVYQGNNGFPLRLQFNSGDIYQFDGDLLTIHDGLNDLAPVLYSGTGNNGDLTGIFVTSTNPDDALTIKMVSTPFTGCSDGSLINIWDYTVGCLDCVPPSVPGGFTAVTDCAASSFTITFDITDLGTDPNVEIANNVGVASTFATGPGSYVAGPFPLDAPVQLTLVNDLNFLCNVTSPSLVNTPCPFLSCGPDNYTHCYANSENYVRIYQGTSTYPLRLQFNSGMIYQFDGDLLTIRDGLTLSDPILYQGTGNNGDLTGIFVTSTNPDYALTLQMVATQFTSCGDGFFTDGWDYTVGCLDCTPPSGSAGAVTTDCAAQTFTVDVTVTDLGTDPQLEIGNDVGVPPTLVSAPGSYVAGPFPVGNPATVTLVNDANALCNVELGVFENSFCPIQISCTGPAFEDSYCYLDGDYQTWLYENTGPESLALLFTGGSIESDTWDHLNIYDGPNNTFPVLFSHNGNYFTEDLTGVLAISTGTQIFMEMSTDGSVSCNSGSLQEWFWTVGCLDCTQPAAEYDVVLDCANNEWYISTYLSDIGSDPTINITNTFGAPSIAVTDTGTYVSGPFPFGVTARVDVVADDNSLCSVHSPYTTNPPCPDVDCGPNQYTWCYGNYVDTAFVYQSASSFPIAVIFNSGALGLYNDTLKVYDGNDYLAPLIYEQFNIADMSGLLFTSSNPDNALTFKITSDFFYSCQDLQYGPMDWSVSCLDCTNPTVSFSMEPDCVHNGYNIIVDVDSLGVNAPQNLMIANSYNTDTIFNVGLGTTVAGPFPVDELTHLTVMNAANPLCRRVSQDYTYPADSCINTACDPMGVEYCYLNADTAWFVYQSGTTDPVTINFLYGQLLVNDYIQIYNGLDTAAQLVYMGNQGGQIGGLAISSSNPDNALTLLVISSQAGSCATGQGFPPLNWAVGCGLVGVNEYAVDGFAMFPNPTNGELHVRVAEGISGTVRMDVMDITGRLVMSEQFNASVGRTERFDLGALNNGNYAVRLSTNNWAKTEQLQVVH